MKRAFISFRIEDRAELNRLRLLSANPAFDIEFYDESVRREIDNTDAAYVRGRFGRRSPAPR